MGGGVGWRGCVVGLGYPQTQWDQLCAKRAVNGSQTTLQGKAGYLKTVMGDWKQLHTDATLLKPAKHCCILFRALQGLEKAI